MATTMIRTSILLAAVCLTATASSAQDSTAHASSDRHTVHVTALDYAFRAPDEVPSGWTTLSFSNVGDEPHFAVLHRLPEGKTFGDYAGEVYPIGNAIWYDVRAGEIDRAQAMQRFGNALPEWYRDVQTMSGTGLIAPGLSSDVTVYLAPGAYVMECYVKTVDGELHAMEGMLRALTVSASPSGQAPPHADVRVTLSNFEMAIDGELKPGTHTISAHAREGTGHSVHVARLAAGTDVQDVVDWMHWLEPDGLLPPSPATFVGGVHILPEGATAYFTVDLEPGRYLFLSQYTAERGVLQEVHVAP